MKPAIRVENLSKSYRLGTRRAASYQTLRETINQSAAVAWNGLRHCLSGGKGTANGASKDANFWALRDVGFEVKPGEVVGIIGRNGAGKSTLLKILSRIVEPTTGRCEFRGRLGSLLEVGTGFHPELTGRENVYMSGSILGMKRREIERKFDEIAAFSEIEAFLDTPVKRYSSGMYVRLAFAVAAHLEPEILIIDEVLAVGDAGFQRKCFAKLNELRKSGRTILVVSHNLGAIQSLCTLALSLEQGRLVSQGIPNIEVAEYLARLTKASDETLIDRKDREGTGDIQVTQLKFKNSLNQEIKQSICGEDLHIEIHTQVKKHNAPIHYLALSCWTEDGIKVFHLDNVQRGHVIKSNDQYRINICKIPRLHLIPGLYHWNVAVLSNGVLSDHIYSVATLQVLPGDYFKIGQTTPTEGGLILMTHDWE